jgi:hypothetical protein
MNDPAANCGAKDVNENFLRLLSPPNVSIGDPVRVLPGFPPKTCGNDILWYRIRFAQQVVENPNP